jgi:cyclophilin family peptidyl-prolyl cis-trans isomerase
MLRPQRALRPLTSSLLSAALVLTGCSTPASSSTDGTPHGGRYAAAPAMTIDTAKTYTAKLVTEKGTIELALDAKAAPITVNNFVFLARDKYYDGLTFHRVESHFVIQGGDPAGDGTGGPGYTIPDEPSPLKHVDGALAMAKSAAPNSAGSQFYITLGAQPALDGSYTVFGVVTSGKDVVKAIAVGDKITSVTISES